MSVNVSISVLAPFDLINMIGFQLSPQFMQINDCNWYPIIFTGSTVTVTPWAGQQGFILVTLLYGLAQVRKISELLSMRSYYSAKFWESFLKAFDRERPKKWLFLSSRSGEETIASFSSFNVTTIWQKAHLLSESWINNWKNWCLSPFVILFLFSNPKQSVCPCVFLMLFFLYHLKVNLK